MAHLFEAFSTGFVIFLLLLSLVGTLIPIIPGVLLMWVIVFIYALVDGFTAVSSASFIFISLIALFTGTSDIWLTLFGTKKGGASIKSMLIGTVGAVVGSFIFPIVGTIAGYIGGLLLGEYWQHGDWEIAKKAGIGGLAGWGVATVIQFIGGIFIFIIFLWQVIF
ncbi:MAG: membrane protein [Ardenticatenaceae bacterium]|nr:MAG: membrane protein [Ardenticatenaceae bacterium]